MNFADQTFKKIYFDAMLDRPVSKFIPAEDLVVPYYASDLKDCERITHVIKMTKNEVTKKMAAGFYRDIDVRPGYLEDDPVTKKERELEGVKKTGRDEDIFQLLECHVNLDLDGFEDKDETGEPTGIKLPNKG